MATQDRGVGLKALLRLRVAHSDAHYAGNLASGSYVLGLFGDVATELLIRLDGDEGLFRAYDNIEFLAPVNGGDFLEVEGEIVKVGNTSRAMRFEARKVAANHPSAGPSAGKVFEPPMIVVRATGTCVTPKELQRHS